MAFDFPATPSVGAVFQPVVGGPTYVWDGVAWKLSAGSLPSSSNLIIADTPPSNPNPGQLWWESDTGRLFVWYADPNTSQWVQVSGPLASASSAAEPYNFVVNGGFQVSQEYGELSGGNSGYYFADQWLQSHGGPLSVTPSIATRKNLIVPPGPGSSSVAGLSRSGAMASVPAGGWYNIRTTFEGLRVAALGLGIANHPQFIVAFHAQFQTAGDYSVRFYNGAQTHRYIGKITVAAGDVGVYKRYQCIIPKNSIIAGVWPIDNSLCTYFDIVLCAGSTYTSAGGEGFGAGSGFCVPTQANGFSTSAQILLGNIGIYRDPQETGVAPPFEPRSWGEDLSDCLRYWEGSAPYGVAQALANLSASPFYSYLNSSTYRCALMFKGRKRAAPAVNVYNGTGVSPYVEGSGGTGDRPSAAVSTVADTGCWVQWTGVAQNTYWFGYTASSRMA